ncbi:MAG: hypothetical protein ABIF71_04825 [Planctomycetota bacterium]
MIKFCGNCGTTITEKELRDGHAAQSGNYVYCGRCAAKLGHVVTGGPLDVLDVQDTTDTQIVGPGHYKLDLPANLFQGADTGDTTSLSARDVRRLNGDVHPRSGSDQKTRPVHPAAVGGKVEVACPGCRVKLRVPVSEAPRNIKCPKCTKVFEVRPPGKSETQAVNKATGLVKKVSGPVRPAAPPARKVTEGGALEPIEAHPDPALTALPGAVPTDGTAPSKPAPAATAKGAPAAPCGREALIGIALVWTLAPFLLFIVPPFHPALTQLGGTVGSGLTAIGLPVPGTAAAPAAVPAAPAAAPEAEGSPAPEVVPSAPAEITSPPAEPASVPPQP